MDERKDTDMGNAINGMAGRSMIAAMDSTQGPSPVQVTSGQIKPLYGTVTEDVTKFIGQVKQFPATAEALVSSRNRDVQ